ncbi:hypothetical protein ACTXG6_19120 [Pseudonocardia sp. Cha107L01]|uniref:hypothetical protein n=1 Tax=Pseudonocardia sp. Cha107L01 TaxID=3457576 RepID=UPI00403EB5DB
MLSSANWGRRWARRESDSVWQNPEHAPNLKGDRSLCSPSPTSSATAAQLACDCGAQLERALNAIADEGCGAVVYLRGHEGRGIGLGHKTRAYALQVGPDTIERRTSPKDSRWTHSRNYGNGAQILRNLGIRRLRLITKNPAKYGSLDGYRLEIVGREAWPPAKPHTTSAICAPSATAWVTTSRSPRAL